MNYYQILGVATTAEDFVIKAAYKALMRAYHPDKNEGFEEKVKLINLAYDTLSNKSKRAGYDDELANSVDESSFDDSSFCDDLDDTLDSDWSVIVDYYPEIEQRRLKLKRYSNSLANSFVLVILETKDTKNHSKIATELKEEFLQSFFGSNRILKKLAEQLLLRKMREPLLEINKAVRVMGNNVEAVRVVSKLKLKFPSIEFDNIDLTVEEDKTIQQLISKARKGRAQHEDLKLLSLRLGFKTEGKVGFFKDSWKIENHDREFWVFSDSDDFEKFLVNHYDAMV